MSTASNSASSGNPPSSETREIEPEIKSQPNIRAEKPLRVACVQYNIKLRRSQKNIRKIKHLTKDIQPGSVDLLLLPEMCLCGYVFTSPEQVAPYLEDRTEGPTYRLAVDLARRLQCHVIAGYPERYVPEEEEQTSQLSGCSDAGVGYISALIVNSTGEFVGNFRKYSLFIMDKCWARAGDGFKYFDLPAPIGRLGLSMSMGLNPRNFDAPWEDYELGNFAYENNIDTLAVPMNWPHSPTVDDTKRDLLSHPDESSLKYWIARLRPLHHHRIPDTRPPKSVVVVTCNNVGKQEGILFAGTSCIMKLSPFPPNIEVVDFLTVAEQVVMIASVK